MSEPVDPNGPWQQPPYGGPPPAWQPPVPTAAPPPWQQPGDYLPYPPPPPPAPRRHTRLIVAIAVAGVLVVVAVVATVLVLRGGNDTTLTAPQSVAGYGRTTGAAAERVQSAIRGFASGVGGTTAEVMNASTIAVYSDQGDVPDLVLVGLTRSRADASGAPSDDGTVVNELLAGAVPDAAPFDAGSHGGVLRCGSATFGAASETMCAWSDSHTVGMLVSISPARPPQELAQVANQFRDKLD